MADTIAVDVLLVDAVTGDRRIYQPEIGWTPADEFLWSEGNFACDCNRSLFLWDWDESRRLACGDGRIRVRITNRATGVELYSDLEEEPCV